MPKSRRGPTGPILIAASFWLTLLLHVSPAAAANGSVYYSYDALGRVASALYDTGVCVVYVYDANGNRISQTVNVGTGTSPYWGTAQWGCFLWQ